MERLSRYAKRLERWGTAIENATLVALFGVMLALAVSQIILRIFFSAGFVWTDELLRLIVMWITLVASIAAGRSDRHLRIDLISHVLPELYVRLSRVLVDVFAAGVCGLLAWQSYRFLMLSIESGDTILVNVPAWTAYCILPFAFLLLAYRFILTAAMGAIHSLRREAP
ncbi:TRAP transporter small permease [Candidatus Entotheonella serta]|nr:TRAP transporter small permease [Candidatus Entotheonella serta]